MGKETLLFHGSNRGLEGLGLCLETGNPLGERGIYQNGLNSGQETSLTPNPKYAIHWGYDVLLVTNLENLLNCSTITELYSNGPSICKFKGSLPSDKIIAMFLDSLRLSSAPKDFLEKVKLKFPKTKIYSYSPDEHEEDGNLPYEIFQSLLAINI